MKINLLLPALLFSLFSFAQATAYIPIAGTKLSMIPPPGFTAATGFSGFQYEAKNASIVVTVIPGPLDEVSKGFSAETIKQNGMTLLDKKIVDLPTTKADLYNVSQEGNGTTYYKKILVFGDAKQTVLINGMYPAASKSLEAGIEKSILSVIFNDKPEEDPIAAAAFSLDVNGTTLQFTKAVSGSLIYTRDGKIPTAAEDKAVFVGSASLTPVAVTDKKQFSLARLKKLPNGETTIAKETNPVTIDNLNGFEIIADGITAEGKKQLVYQVILFIDKGGYYILYGSAADKLENNLADFKKIAQTFQQKK